MIEFRHGKEANIGNVKDTDGIIVTSDTNRLFVLVNGKRYQVSDAIKVESSISVSNLIEGKMYYETDTNKLFYYNGTSKIYTGDSSGSGSEGSITIDTELSSTSTNAVQNKAIKAALDKKVDAVSGKGLSTNDYTNDEKAKVANFTVDSELSDSSTHAIQNKIVKEAIDELKASIGSGGTGETSTSTNYKDINPLLETKNMFAISDNTSDIVNFNGKGGTLTADNHKILIFRVHIGDDSSSFLLISKTRDELVYSVIAEGSGLNVKETTSPAGNTLYTATLSTPFTSTDKFNVQYGSDYTATINGTKNEFSSAIQCNTRTDIPKFVLDLADFVLYDKASSTLFPSGWYPEKDKLNNTVGDISTLNTTANESIVEAINELVANKVDLNETEDVTLKSLYIPTVTGRIYFGNANSKDISLYRASVAGGSKLMIQCNNEFAVSTATKDIINYVVASSSNTGLNIGNNKDTLRLNGSSIIFKGAYSSSKYNTDVAFTGDTVNVDLISKDAKFGVLNTANYGIITTPTAIKYSGSSEYSLIQFNTTDKVVELGNSSVVTRMNGNLMIPSMSYLYFGQADSNTSIVSNTSYQSFSITAYGQSLLASTGGSSGSVSLGNPDQGTTVNGSSIKLNADTVTFTKDTVTTRDAYIPSSAAIRFGTTTSTSYTSMALEYVGGSSLGLAISMNGSKYVTIYNNHHNPIFRISEADSTVSFGLGGYTVNISGTSINLSGSINSGSITSDSVITASCFKATESADMSKFHDVSCDKLEATEATLNGECTINNDCHISGWTRVGNDLDVTGDFTAEGSASCTGLSAYSSTNSNVPLLSVGLDSSVYIGRKQQVSGGACMVSSTTICGTLAIESSAYLSSYSTSISYYDINTGNVNCSNYLRTSEIDGAGSTSCITFWTKSNAPGIYYDSAGKIGFAIGCTGGTATYSLGVILEASIGNCFRPNGDGNISLGSPDYRWATIFSSSSSISTSDRNEKNSIKDIDEETAVLLVEGLKPSTYKFNDSNSDRTHYGFIAQDIEELINSLGIDTKDFAAVCKDVKKQEVDVLETIEYKELDEETGEVTIKTKQEPTKKLVEVVADDGETQYMYGLRYEELIAPIVSHAQYLYKKTEALEKENSELKSTLASVLERLDKLESN